MHFHIVTLFPESIDGYLNSSILGRAQKDKKIKISFYNPRDYTKNAHRRVDQKPYGGGPGMVLEAEAVLRAAQAAIGRKKDVCVVFFTPAGKQFDTDMAKRYAQKYTHIVCICGHYEGVDERVRGILKATEISIGPFVLTGGELPAAVLIDAVSRFIPGVLGTYDSLEGERTASSDVYTRPEVFVWKGKKYRVPKVLLSGDHKKIEEWKKNR
ncbi:tRNA (guanosine(37)-N1)-methyltransferase TrmD [Candidatus Kaiserbacteria bacterium CG10_big_fil_rev_8_21_14_0_10_49_17]|uniref:tRNA (guanine-N(1)-)-methyltransferase n=1 Tax=Candidatus Kaiserbacteria bacterium CG10_big_fil_rev_8_21_14_0_10_49_17 TaxID=1974609 RepID=A0A2M6WF03_9BACT|nr:MAG: tRNA (guanosine(37)-N1)-methyltransferase TrmD [Candidatus Kaiserbacteria bacterium CG10_big_fil_rev_8_21_14_0_10_49_17]